MSKGLYQHLRESWGSSDELSKERLFEWRRQDTVERIERPTRLDRARSLGYKAKQGYILARVRVTRGGRRRHLYGRRGRKPSKSGLVRFTSRKSDRWIAEEKAQRRFVNCSALNSYPVGEDGRHKWFEVILCDVNHPNIKNDSKISWITKGSNNKRALYGLTSAGKRSRGLRA